MDCVRRRGKIYSVVVTVPADLIDVVGKKQLWRSLKTKSYDVARSEARQLLHTVEQLFKQIRGGMDSRLINGMVAEYALDWLNKTDATRTFFAVVNNTKEKRAAKSARYQDYTESVQDLILSGTSAEVLGAVSVADGCIDKLGLTDLTATDKHEIVTAVAQTIRLLLKVESERVTGITETESDFQTRILDKWNKEKIVKKDVGIPLPELLAEYGAQWKNDNPARVKRKVTELKRLAKSFRDCFKRDVGAKELDDDSVLQWYQFLADDNGNSYHTIDNNRKTMSAVFNDKRTKKRNYVDSNPFSDGLPFDKEGLANEQSRGFTDNELQQYVDLLADYYNPEALEMTWLPVIMMYTGMRPNEVAQLFLDDIQTTLEGHYFRITKNVDRKQWVKTNASRAVPIHEKLKELGFMEYVERLRRVGESQLFPNCKSQKSTGYYYSDAMSMIINAVINLHIDAGKKLRLYSLRKNFRSRLDNLLSERFIAAFEGTGSAEVIPLLPYFERAVNDIMGHAMKGTTGDKVYRDLDIRVKAAVMGVMNHPVDLSRLKVVLTDSTI